MIYCLLLKNNDITKIEDSYNYRGSYLPLLFGLSKFAQLSLCPSHSGHAYGSRLKSSPNFQLLQHLRVPSVSKESHKVDRSTPMYISMSIPIESNRSTPICIDADLYQYIDRSMPIYWCRSFSASIDADLLMSIPISRSIDRSLSLHRHRYISIHR